jgi:hypothetical protein
MACESSIAVLKGIQKYIRLETVSSGDEKFAVNRKGECHVLKARQQFVHNPYAPVPPGDLEMLLNRPEKASSEPKEFVQLQKREAKYWRFSLDVLKALMEMKGLPKRLMRGKKFDLVRRLLIFDFPTYFGDEDRMSMDPFKTDKGSYYIYNQADEEVLTLTLATRSAPNDWNDVVQNL